MKRKLSDAAKAVIWWEEIPPQDKQSLIFKSKFLAGTNELRRPSSLTITEVLEMYKRWGE